jgi:PPOX class probable F420-dependent enzyme
VTASIFPATTPAAASPVRAALADARFIDLVTYRRTGEPVGNPVLFVMRGDRLFVRTAHDAGKLKRLRHTSRVEVAPCDSRGRRMGAAASGCARVLGEEAVGPALALLHTKYRVAGRLFTTLRHRRGKEDVISEIELDRDPSAA